MPSASSFWLCSQSWPFLWFIAVSRLHMKNPQCLEIVLYITIGGFGALLALTHVIGRRRKREENWPYPPLVVDSRKDDRFLKEAQSESATLLGYNVHEEPWFWPDAIRMKHGVLVGGTGAGKSTTLMNIIRQDLNRVHNGRKDADDHSERKR